jgi:hypothetical protein
MKSVLRGLASVAVFALSVSPVFAADPPSYGVEAGANLTTVGLSGPDTVGVDSAGKAGMIVGGFVSVPVAPRVAIQPEAVYVRANTKLSASGFSATTVYDAVEVPVLAKFDLTSMKRATFYAVAGPGFRFTTRAKLTDQIENGTPQPDEDIKDTTTSVDVSFVVGAGVMFGKFGVEGRYDGGLRNLNSDTDASTFKLKARTGTILVRWSFK